MRGGRDSYLCEEDASAFEGLVVQHANQMNCLTTLQAIDIAWLLRRVRQVKASDLLASIGSADLSVKVRMTQVPRPDKSWIAEFAHRMGISVMTAESIELARRQACNEKAIRDFFEKFSGELDRDPHLILNCDETHVSSRKRFKVLAPDGYAALKKCREKLPHFSAMCTITGSGQKLRPMFILPEFVSLPPDLIPLTNDAYFASSGTGWMTQRTFLMYAHFLLYELKIYRLTLPVELRQERFLLILDGHSSRWTFEAIYILRVGGIDVLVLPSHCTHVLQVFDVSIAGALKVFLAQFCEELELTFDEFHQLVATETIPESMGEKRRWLLEAFLNAWDKAACRSNILSGFKKCGIVPLKPEIPLANHLTRKMFPNEFFRVSGSLLTDMNCAMVTKDDRLEILKAKPNVLFPRHEEKLTRLSDQWRELIADPVVSGRYLAGPSGFVWYSQQPGRPTAFEVCDYPRYACQVREQTPAVVWQISCKLASNLPILVVLPNSRECAVFAEYLKQNDIEYAKICARTSDDTREDWYRFQTGQVDVCVSTNVALRGMTFARRVVSVYPRVPAVQMLLYTSLSNALILFRDRQELTQLEHGNIKFKVLARTYYDPMEVL
jgi:hypothetical protein